MAVKFISIKCPECGANLEMEQDRKVMFCSYCGRKIMMVDENEFKYDVTHRHVDVAKIREVEEESKRKAAKDELDKEKFDKFVELAGCVLLVIVVIIVMIFFHSLM